VTGKQKQGNTENRVTRKKKKHQKYRVRSVGKPLILPSEKKENHLCGNNFGQINEGYIGKAQ